MKQDCNRQMFPLAFYSIFDDSDRTYNSSADPEEEHALITQRRALRRRAQEATTMPSRMVA